MTKTTFLIDCFIENSLDEYDIFNFISENHNCFVYSDFFVDRSKLSEKSLLILNIINSNNLKLNRKEMTKIQKRLDDRIKKK